MLTVHPRPGSSASQRYSGVSRKTGSITRRAALIRAVSRRVSGMTRQRSAAGAEVARPSTAAVAMPAVGYDPAAAARASRPTSLTPLADPIMRASFR
jgi:hypothetical protein